VEVREVPGHPGLLARSDGRVIGPKGRPLGRPNQAYVSVHVRKPDGRATTVGAHVLVALAFLGPRPDGHEVAHRDGNPTNGRPENLRWSTHVDNMADKVQHGTEQSGERNGNRKLTEDDVRAIRAAVAAGAQHRDVAARFGITHANVGYIARRQTWRHVP